MADRSKTDTFGAIGCRALRVKNRRCVDMSFTPLRPVLNKLFRKTKNSFFLRGTKEETGEICMLKSEIPLQVSKTPFSKTSF